MLTYFVHSTSIDNLAKVRPGWSDVRLSLKGEAQAKALAAIVDEKLFDRVYCSDLIRAMQTAKIVFPNSDMRPDARLREMSYGVLNGAPASDFPEDESRCIENAFEGGECCLDVQVRIEDFIASEHDAASYIAIVAHRVPQLALEVICHERNWQQALNEDWRHKGSWQPGWQYLPGSN